MNRAGIETLLMNIYRNLDREKIQFDFLVQTYKKNDYEDEIKKLGGRIYKIKRLNVFKPHKFYNDLRKFFKNHNEYEIVHSHINTFSKIVLKAAAKENIKVKIAHAHTSYAGFNLKMIIKYLYRLNINKYADYKFACSYDAAKWVFGNNKEYILFKNGIEYEKFLYNDKTRNKIRKELGLSNNDILIGHVGRFSKSKNHDFLIDAFKELQKKNDNSYLMLVGKGVLEDLIKEKVKRYNLTEKVSFMGVRNDVYKLMQAMDVFAFPSTYEGLPIAVVEAQAASLPCLVSNNVSKEVVIDPNLIDYASLKDSPKKWAEKMMKLYKSNSNRKIIDITNLEKNGYNIKTNSKKLQDFYLSKISEY
jgi:glycosyltransferase involved in cell wall biosynthesis